MNVPNMMATTCTGDTNPEAPGPRQSDRWLDLNNQFHVFRCDHSARRTLDQKEGMAARAASDAYRPQ
jgi:hypothetical protein